MYIKEIGIFVIGSLVGVGCTCKFFKTKYEDYANEEIESVKEMAKKQINELKKIDIIHGGDGSNFDIYSDKAASIVKEEKEKIARRTKPRDAIAYNNIVSHYNKEANAEVPFQENKPKVEEVEDEKIEDEEETEDDLDDDGNPIESDEERLMNLQTSSNQTPQEPFVISPDQFVQECKNYDKITITYYQRDDVLVDEDGEPIIDEKPIIGEALTHFGDMDADDNLVYVRNEKYDIDYEVIKEDLSYAGDILGFDER